jgi:hypothetical protein
VQLEWNIVPESIPVPHPVIPVILLSGPSNVRSFWLSGFPSTFCYLVVPVIPVISGQSNNSIKIISAAKRCKRLYIAY